MKNIDNIILNSLRLINYDRSKHITEQSSYEENNGNVILEVDMDGFEPYDVQKMERNLEIDRLEKERAKYDANPIITPGVEDTDNENDIPYLTYKSVVNNKNIYLPQKTITVQKVKNKKQTPSFMGNLLKGSKYNLIKPFELPTPTFEKKKVKLLENKVIKEVTTSEPFNQEIAENYFGSQCLKLSGGHPKYDVGYVKELDYYVDNSGTQCSPIPYKTITKNTFGKDGKSSTSTEVDVWQLDLPKPVTLKNGNNIQKSKFKYPKGCNPVGYQFCLIWSWKSLYSNGSQDLAVLEFEESSSDPNTSTGSAGGFEPTNQVKTIYRGCVTDEWYPWTNSFVGYLKKSDFKVGSDSAGKRQYTKCVRNGYSTTGVNLIEDYLSKYNFQSGVKTLDFVEYNKVLQFTLPEAIKKSTGKDFKVFGNYIDYTVDLNQWFTWGSKDYKNYNAGVNVNFQDYLNNVDKERDLYDDYLKDFYGVEKKDELGKGVIDNQVGIQGLDQMLNDEKTLSALKAKWDDIVGKYNQKGDYYSILIKISEEYNTENSKPKKNNLVLSYLESLWNKILGESRFEGSFLYNEKTNTNKTIEQFTILYLNYFGIVDKNNKNVNNTIDGNENNIDIELPFNNSIFSPKKEKKLGFGILKPEIYENQEIIEITKTNPLMVPSDYSNYMNTGKKAKPVTILDAKNRAKSEGPTNGFKYQEQTLQIESQSKTISNQFTYQSIVSSLPNVPKTEEKSSKSGGQTPEDLEVILATYKKYDEDIAKVINSTIVLIGR